MKHKGRKEVAILGEEIVMPGQFELAKSEVNSCD